MIAHAHLRAATLLSALEARADLDADLAPDTGPRALRLGASAVARPLALLILGSDWPSYLASSLFGRAGAILNARRAPGDDRLAWMLGAGIDLPLTDPDHGAGPWITLEYAARFGAPRHLGLVSLSWRLPLARLPP